MICKRLKPNVGNLNYFYFVNELVTIKTRDTLNIFCSLLQFAKVVRLFNLMCNRRLSRR